MNTNNRVNKLESHFKKLNEASKYAANKQKSALDKIFEFFGDSSEFFNQVKSL